MTMPRARMLAGLGVTVTLLATRGTDAGAHASLVRCTIAPNAVLASAPHVVTWIFAEGVNPRGSFVHVFTASSDRAQVDLDNS